MLLLRLLPGIGIGREWGGAVLMVLEHFEKDRCSVMGSLVQIGFPAGTVLAMLAFRALSEPPEAGFLSWGWRIPLLVRMVLAFIGLLVRPRLVETPSSRDLQARRATL